MISNLTPSTLLDKYWYNLLDKLIESENAEIAFIDQAEEELLFWSKEALEQWIKRINHLILTLEQEFEASWEMKLWYLSDTFGISTIKSQEDTLFWDIWIIVKMWNVAIALYQNKVNYELSKAVWKYFEMRNVIWESYSRKKKLLLDIQSKWFWWKVLWFTKLSNQLSHINKQVSLSINLIVES